MRHENGQTGSKDSQPDILHWPQWTSIRTKLTLGFAAALILVIGVGFFGVYQLRQVNLITQKLSEISVPKIASRSNMRRGLVSHFSFAK